MLQSASRRCCFPSTAGHENWKTRQKRERKTKRKRLINWLGFAGAVRWARWKTRTTERTIESSAAAQWRQLQPLRRHAECILLSKKRRLRNDVGDLRPAGTPLTWYIYYCFLEFCSFFLLLLLSVVLLELFSSFRFYDFASQRAKERKRLNAADGAWFKRFVGGSGGNGKSSTSRRL